jgi:hypothetical protein
MSLVKRLKSIFKGKNKKTYEKINPKTCPHAKGYLTTIEGLAQNFICSRCGALVNNTPFGKELLSEDARDRFPEAATWAEVERWKDPIYALLREDKRSKSADWNGKDLTKSS